MECFHFLCIICVGDVNCGDGGVFHPNYILYAFRHTSKEKKKKKLKHESKNYYYYLNRFLYVCLCVCARSMILDIYKHKSYREQISKEKKNISKNYSLTCHKHICFSLSLYMPSFFLIDYIHLVRPLTCSRFSLSLCMSP